MIKVYLTIEEVPTKGTLVSWDKAESDPVTNNEKALTALLTNAITPIVMAVMADVRKACGGTISIVQTKDDAVRESYKKRFKDGR